MDKERWNWHAAFPCQIISHYIYHKTGVIRRETKPEIAQIGHTRNVTAILNAALVSRYPRAFKIYET